MSDTNNSLVNFGNNKIVEKAYDDIISNPGKKIGDALGTIINIGNTLLWPVKWANERTRIYFENNLKKYEERLSKIEDDKIIEVPTEISMPILERFTYVSNEEISDAFINLLISASNIDTIQFAHPSFIQIIDRLSPDEARIIKFFQKNNPIPYITLSHYVLEKRTENDFLNSNYKQKLNTSQYITLCSKSNKIRNSVELNFRNNLLIYLDNLISLGIIRDVNDRYYSTVADELKDIENELTKRYKSFFDTQPEHLRDSSKKIEKGMFELTEFGKLFIKSSIK